MYKLIAMYKTPADPEAFMDHYENVHLPIARRIPGLKEAVVNKVLGSPFGETDIFLIAELHFADKESFDLGMQSPENREAGKDLANFAKGLVTVLFTGP